MFGRVLGENEDIVKVYDDQGVNKVMEDVIHKAQ
jgi:hypothetical protein